MTQTTIPLISRPTEAYHLPHQNLKPRNNNLDFRTTLSTQDLGQRSLVFKSITGFSPVRCSRDSVVPGEDDNRALETVHKLYKAIKNRNLRELSDVIGDECRCVCNFVSFLHLFHGKQQVLEFFSFLLGSLGKNVEIIVRPTMHEGMTVGVQWRLEWKTTHWPLGKGITFHTMHVYQGKVTIKSIEMFMEPLLNIEPTRLKLMGFVMSLSDKIGSNIIIKEKGKKILYITIGALLIFVLLVLFRGPWF
ncbi:uncharacterized protein LOC122643652 [Telopea speciosissima]|uniref:uncharacterized protein LOC122643652 n=1 Tax=Telopea speciosissima TaxID=54955 RepID=UPI001CC5482F|nr:uncharacterized protein LOC122643652 [Telopea speciosissima]